MGKFKILLAAIILGLCTTGAGAATKKVKKHPAKQVVQPAPPLTYSLWNADTGEWIKGDNEWEVRPLASITKLMSAIVTVKADLDMDEMLTVTGKERSTHIQSGMKVARGRLVELALVSSDNLATRTLAETYPGGYSQFIQKMNNTAEDLGMTSTRFHDSTGLTHDNISTAQDIRRLVLAASELAPVNYAASSRSISFTAVLAGKKRAKEVVVHGNNTNRFAGKLDILAAKTGFTNSAGRCLTMLFNRNGARYVLVVLGASSSEHRYKTVESLIDSIK